MRERFTLSVAIFGVLLRSDHVLLIRRSGTGWLDGYYSVPAGALEPEETLAEGIRREIFEEVGIAVPDSALQHVHTAHNRTEGKGWLGVYFAARHWTGEERIMEPHKHDAIIWSPLDALPENTVPYVGRAIKLLTEGQTYSEYGWQS